MAIRIASLWKKKVKRSDGTDDSFIAGNTGPVILPAYSRIYLRANDQKAKDSHPDYFVEVVEPKKRKANDTSGGDGEAGVSVDELMDIPF